MTLPTHRLLTIGYRLSAWLRCELAWYRAILHWHLYSDTKCAWCGKTTRKAWRQPKTTSHGMCKSCAAKWKHESHSSHASHASHPCSSVVKP